MNDDEKAQLNRMIKSFESKGLDSSILKDDIYDIKQKFVLGRAISTATSLENIANPDISADEMEFILDEQLDMIKNLEVNHNLDPAKYDLKQLQELDKALEKGLDISHYKDPAFSPEQMYLATTFQEGGIDQMEKIKPEMSTNEIINLRTVRVCMANGMENLPTLDKLDTPEGLTLKELQNLIIHGADVNKSIDNDENQVSFAPLEIIAYKNNTAEALLLLRNGADVEYSGDSGETALTVTRSPEMAKLLIEHGANINHVNDRGETALTNAVQGYRVIDQLELVTVLLEKGADPNNKNIFGNTPLHDLNQNSDSDIAIAKKLIEHGANPEVLNRHGERPQIMNAPELQKFLETQADLPPWENSKFYKHQDQSRDYVMSDKSTGKHIFLNSNEEVFELLAKHDPDGIIDKLRTTGKLELSNGETLDLTVDSPEKVGDSLAQELNIPHITVEDKRTAECLQHDSGMEID